MRQSAGCGLRQAGRPPYPLDDGCIPWWSGGMSIGLVVLVVLGVLTFLFVLGTVKPGQRSGDWLEKAKQDLDRESRAFGLPPPVWNEAAKPVACPPSQFPEPVQALIRNGVNEVWGAVFRKVRSEQLEAGETYRAAQALADAVRGELCGGDPVSPDGMEVKTGNAARLNHELAKLRTQEDLCDLLTQTIRLRGFLAIDAGADPVSALLDPVERLKALGMFRAELEQPGPERWALMVAAFVARHPKPTIVV